MKTNIIAPVGGLIILAVGLSVAAYTATSIPAKRAANAQVVTKYLSLSDAALKKNNAKQAESFVKKAIAADPTNKKAIAAFKKITLLSCPKAAAPVTQTSAAPTAQPAAKQAPAEKAAAPEADTEEEMGCI